MALKERSVIPPEIAEIICTTEVSVDSPTQQSLNIENIQTKFIYLRLQLHISSKVT